MFTWSYVLPNVAAYPNKGADVSLSHCECSLYVIEPKDIGKIKCLTCCM